MHVIVANIPEHFHSRDLRNFFSEFIEKEAFNCFHHRHRPQTQLTNIMKCSTWASPNPDAPRKDPRCPVIWRSDDSDTSESAQITVSSNAKPSRTQTPEMSEASDKGDPKTGTSGARCSVAQGRNSSGTHSQLTCFNSEALKITKPWHSKSKTRLDTEAETEGDRDASKGSGTHWLSSGLAGLASLISEKKREVRPGARWSESAKRTCEEKKEIQNPGKGDSNGKTGCCEGEEGAKEYHKGGFQEQRDARRQNESGSGDGLEESTIKWLSPSLGEEASRMTCCVVDVKDGLGEMFVRKYDCKHWLTRTGDALPQRCCLLRVNFRDSSQGDVSDDNYKTRQELSALSLVPGCPKELVEFRPPPGMPQGNVGTPTRHFQDLIRACKMPGTLIKKLGLEFARGRRKKRFGQVPFDYGTSVSPGQEDKHGQTEREIAFTAAGHLIPSSVDFQKQQKRRGKEKETLPKRPMMELEEEREDGAEVEEWERYEPFHNDVTSQERIKERRFEEELEVVWEKGGSGLVFYTDAQFWRAQEGDFDEQTADEWDVDMSVYYEGTGDKDARDGVAMRTSDKLRAGSLQQSVFERKEEESGSHEREGRKRRRKIGPTPPPTIGSFEAHTKGFGRRLMEAQGWQDGQGLGTGAAGMPYALQSEGQHPHNRKGFGYHGEKLQHWASTITHRPRLHHISTIFDRAEDVDPPPPPLRTPEPTTLAHRPAPHLHHF